MSEPEPRKPQRGEMWLHEFHNAVTVLRRWGKDESVCRPIKSPRNLILQDLLMLGRIEHKDGKFFLHKKNGEIIELEPEYGQQKTPPKKSV